MYDKQPKKLIIINILDILKKYSDEDHRLSQKDIVDILRDEYDMNVDRKAVRRNILDLMEYGCDIEYTESVRKIKDRNTGQTGESCVWSDYYLVRDFTDSELRLLIDGVIFSKNIPHRRRLDLVSKLEGLSNVYFRAHVRHIHTMQDSSPQNKQLFYTIEILDEAISGKKQVAFKYIEYGPDKKQHLRKRADGSVREYIINPYQMAAKEGKYYLICNNDKYDDISNYRIDRITDIRLLDSPVKPYDSLPDSEKDGLDLAEYMKEHVYMYSSRSTRVKFRIGKNMISEVIDMFGADVDFYGETEKDICVTTKVNLPAMKQFAKIYAPGVVILEPKELADELKNEALQVASLYE